MMRSKLKLKQMSLGRAQDSSNSYSDSSVEDGSKKEQELEQVLWKIVYNHGKPEHFNRNCPKSIDKQTGKERGMANVVIGSSDDLKRFIDSKPSYYMWICI